MVHLDIHLLSHRSVNRAAIEQTGNMRHIKHESLLRSGIAGQVTYWRVSDIHKTIDHFEAHGCRKFRG